MGKTGKKEMDEKDEERKKKRDKEKSKKMESLWCSDLKEWKKRRKKEEKIGFKNILKYKNEGSWWRRKGGKVKEM